MGTIWELFVCSTETVDSYILQTLRLSSIAGHNMHFRVNACITKKDWSEQNVHKFCAMSCS